MWVIILKSPKGRWIQSTKNTLPHFISSRSAIIVLMLYSCSLTKCLTFCDPHELQMPGFLVLHYLSEFAQTLVHWVSDAIQPSHLLLPLLLPSIFPSIRFFSNEPALCIRWPKYWNFSFSIRPFNEYSGLISFSTDWFDLLAVQGTLKSLLQSHSSKVSILWRSAFLMIQLSHPYVTFGENQSFD